MDNFVADAIFIDASVERVFSALLEPEDVLEWMEASEARIAPAEGGEFTLVREDGSTVSGTIAEVTEGRTLRIDDYHWEQAGKRRGPMKVTFTLEPHDDGVWITVRQDGLDSDPDWEEFAAATRKSWVRATVALKRFIEGI